jgi:hypothetical protein
MSIRSTYSRNSAGQESRSVLPVDRVIVLLPNTAPSGRRQIVGPELLPDPQIEQKIYDSR